MTDWKLHDNDHHIVGLFQSEDAYDIVRWQDRIFQYDERCGQYIETTITDVVSIDFKARAEEHFKK